MSRIKKITSKELIQFTNEIKDIYNSGKIRAPIHLSGNNEYQLIKIFKKITKKDWVFSTWRSHYHALLKGIPANWLKKEIIAGRSMGIINKRYNFYASSIVGGIIPIALGVAMSIKLKNKKNKVWVFIGDMTFETGIFHECYKYAKSYKLPIKFIIEDNKMSTDTPTEKIWIKRNKIPNDVIYYKYERKYPHHGTNKWVLF